MANSNEFWGILNAFSNMGVQTFAGRYDSRFPHSPYMEISIDNWQFKVWIE